MTKKVSYRRLEKLDNYLLDVHRSLAEGWERKTGRGKVDLQRLLFLGSGALLIGEGVSLVGWRAGIVGGYFAARGVYTGCVSSKGANEDFEGRAGPLMKAMTAAGYLSGVACLPLGVGFIAKGLLQGNPRDIYIGAHCLSCGAGMIAGFGGVYTERAEISPL